MLVSLTERSRTKYYIYITSSWPLVDDDRSTQQYVDGVKRPAILRRQAAVSTTMAQSEEDKTNSEREQADVLAFLGIKPEDVPDFKCEQCYRAERPCEARGPGKACKACGGVTSCSLEHQPISPKCKSSSRAAGVSRCGAGNNTGSLCGVGKERRALCA